MANKGIIESILPSIDSILSIRDRIGAYVHKISLVTRTWSGTQIGDGTAIDDVALMQPTPAIRNFSQDIRLKEGGAVKAGDIILSGVSRHSYQMADLDGSSPGANIEKLYLVGDKLYQVINVTEKYVTFDVQLRELTNQTRY